MKKIKEKLNEKNKERAKYIINKTKKSLDKNKKNIMKMKIKIEFNFILSYIK